MRITLISLGLALALVGAAGCKKEKKAAETPPADDTKTAPAAETPPPAETPPAEPPPPAEDPSKPDMANKMANCPSAAPGATTTVKADKAAVTVSVTAKDAKDKAAIAEIQKRAKTLSASDAAADTEVKHTGKGTGGGQLGKCPVVMTDVTLKVKNTKAGADIMMTPKDKTKLGDLETMAKERVEAMPAMDAAGSAGGDEGGGKMDEGKKPDDAKKAPK